MAGRMQRWLDGLLADPSVPVDEHLGAKRSALNLLLFMTLVIFASALMALRRTGFAPVTLLALAAIPHHIAVAAVLLSTRRLAPVLVACWYIPIGAWVLGLDFVTRGVYNCWSLLVLVMDGLLAYDAPVWASQVVLALAVIFFLVTAAQGVNDFGLWDVADTAENYAPYQCPELTLALGAIQLCIRFSSFFFDFYVTRSFVQTTRAQYEAMAASQRVTETLTSLLSGYQVDEAQQLLEGRQEAALPPELRDSFLQLIVNLRTYKPFLPQSCLPGEEDLEEDAASTRSKVRHSVASSAYSGALKHHRGTECLDGGASPGSECSSFSSAERASAASGSVTGLAAAPPMLRGAVHAAPVRQRASCICVNQRGFLRWSEHRAVSTVQGLLQREIDRFARLTSLHRGVVDYLSGDHLSASFNAARSRACVSHRLSAARTATAYTQGDTDGSVPAAPDAAEALPLQLTAAAVSGQMLCGDFGSASIVRFMIIGGVHSLLRVLERVAANWNVHVLVDSTIHADLAETWQCRLLGAVTFGKLPAEILIWGAEKERAAPAEDGPQEWMYELASRGPDPWQVHARTLRLWLKGDIDAAQATAEAALKTDIEGLVAAALRRALADIAAGAGPPRWELSEGGTPPMGTTEQSRSRRHSC
eukprot:TRINITY_DN14011_c0_g3_i1.p1 TRINITY_DN14011_c0_g3~~TRINITY_DN14011_c0_g3_i1.p1  ORF type:complete len:647 (+),score=123.12 TRINITY_DN14011_c0_g3_i1:70-2010(+)